jgi:mono/diheme cytochrome c family protein
MSLRSRFAGVCVLAAAFGFGGTTRNSGAPPAPEAPAKPQPATFSKDVLPFLNKHCFACHGNGKKRGELSLEKYRDDESLQKERKVWETVLQMLRNGEMPPKGRQRPAEAEIAAVLRGIEGISS